LSSSSPYVRTGAISGPLVADFTTATRAEPGNIFFEWSRSVDNPNQFVLVEAFRDRRAGEAHVNSDQFKTAMAWMPDAISDTPQIVNVKAPGDGWARMAELQPAGLTRPSLVPSL
jgi:quinol monooxygenase YgiN